ncbi:MAG: HK97 gp10 family phage protein [Lachnospiraceae bacterium]|nr:HK97 gp10 family phage protein [Lachnospiraceae bacterium]
MSGGQYVQVDVTELKEFCEKVRKAGDGELKRELAEFLDGTGFEVLRIIEDEIIRVKAVDTRQLLHSFHKGSADGIYELNEGDLTLEIGTNVEYAQWVNDGHHQTPGRFIPGEWTGNGKFRYSSGAKTGMVLQASWVEGKHYMEHSVKAIEKIFPKLVEKKLTEWFTSYFS